MSALVDSLNFQLDTLKLCEVTTISDKKIGILYNNSCSTFQDILNILQNKIHFKSTETNMSTDYKSLAFFNKKTNKIINPSDLIGEDDALYIKMESGFTSTDTPELQISENYDDLFNTVSSTLIYCKTLTGKTIPMNIDLNKATIWDLKHKINEYEKVNPASCRLICNGRQMYDSNLLSDYKIGKESTIYIILRLKGGMYQEVSGRNGGYLPIPSMILYNAEIDEFIIYPEEENTAEFKMQLCSFD